jgi:hypothetical protein
MPARSDYPSSIHEILDPAMKFKPAALRAVKAFACSRPWRGSLDERKDKFRALIHSLADAYRVAPPQLVFGKLDGGDSGRSCYIPRLNAIVLVGKLSAVTALHEFGHCRGMNEREACRWSVNIFRRCFPRSFARCRFEGHQLRAGDAGGQVA